MTFSDVRYLSASHGFVGELTHLYLKDNDISNDSERRNKS
jgi:hypothetical protein